VYVSFDIYKALVGFEVLMEISVKYMVVTVVMACSLERAWCFRETYPLHLPGWKRCVPPK
jgi:hypothetical protein